MKHQQEAEDGSVSKRVKTAEGVRVAGSTNKPDGGTSGLASQSVTCDLLEAVRTGKRDVAVAAAAAADHPWNVLETVLPEACRCRWTELIKTVKTEKLTPKECAKRKGYLIKATRSAVEECTKRGDSAGTRTVYERFELEITMGGNVARAEVLPGCRESEDPALFEWFVEKMGRMGFLTAFDVVLCIPISLRVRLVEAYASNPIATAAIARCIEDHARLDGKMRTIVGMAGGRLLYACAPNAPSLLAASAVLSDSHLRASLEWKILG